MRPRHPVLDHPGPLAFAHRGGAGEAPENSPAAIRRTVALGYRYLETDLRVTADGVVVLFHDATLDRATDRRGRVADLRWHEVARARIAGGQPIPTLEQVLCEHPDLRLNVDVKDAAVVAPFVRLMRRTRSLDRVCVSSFGGRRLRAVRRALGPGLATSLAPDEAARLVAAGRVAARAGDRGRRLAAVPDGAVCVQVPARLGRVAVVDPGLVDTAHALGLQVHVWTVDDPATMHRLLDLGVDGLMTDRPSVLRAVLEQRGAWV